MLPAEFIREWGQADLLRYAPDIVKPLNISEAAKQFLIEAGLPRVAMRYLYYDLPPNDLPLLSRFLDGRFSPPQSCAHYRIIGIYAFNLEEFLTNQSEIFDCIDESEGGRIVNVRADKNWEVNFLNSSIPQFAEFLLSFRQDLEWRQASWYDSTREEILAHGKEVLERLRHVDLAACGPLTAWGGEGGKLFEIEHGL